MSPSCILDHHKLVQKPTYYDSKSTYIHHKFNIMPSIFNIFTLKVNIFAPIFNIFHLKFNMFFNFQHRLLLQKNYKVQNYYNNMLSLT